jgi:hypothetical protein
MLPTGLMKCTVKRKVPHFSETQRWGINLLLLSKLQQPMLLPTNNEKTTAQLP